MCETQNLIKVGNVVLTPEAIGFIDYLQEENNSSLKCVRQQLLESINSANLLLNSPNTLAEKHIKSVIENLTQLSILYYDLDKLSKP